jgi:hypothetical protein
MYYETNGTGVRTSFFFKTPVMLAIGDSDSVRPTHAVRFFESWEERLMVVGMGWHWGPKV